LLEFVVTFCFSWLRFVFVVVTFCCFCGYVLFVAVMFWFAFGGEVWFRILRARKRAPKATPHSKQEADPARWWPVADVSALGLKRDDADVSTLAFKSVSTLGFKSADVDVSALCLTRADAGVSALGFKSADVDVSTLGLEVLVLMSPPLASTLLMLMSAPSAESSSYLRLGGRAGRAGGQGRRAGMMGAGPVESRVHAWRGITLPDCSLDRMEAGSTQASRAASEFSRLPTLPRSLDLWATGGFQTGRKPPHFLCVYLS
jgi:hypothetical protein